MVGWVGRWVDGRMGGRFAGWMEGRVDGWQGGRVSGRFSRWIGGWVDGWLSGRVSGWLAGWMGGWVKADAEVILYCTYGKNMFLCFNFLSIYCRKPYSTKLLHVLLKKNMFYDSPLSLHGSSLLDVWNIPPKYECALLRTL